MAPKLANRRPQGSVLSKMATVNKLAVAGKVALALRPPPCLPGPTVHISIKALSLTSSGRVFLTLRGPDEEEHRTEVAEESRTPQFQARIFSLSVQRDVEAPLAPIRIGVTKLAFSRGATEVGAASVEVAALLASHTGGVQQRTLELLSSKGARVGTVEMEYTYEDQAEEARLLAERQAAEREAAQAAARAAAEERAAAAAEAARAQREKVEEEAVIDAQRAQEQARLDAYDRKREQARLTAMAKAAVAAAEEQQAAVQGLLQAEAERQATQRQWQAVLAAPVHLIRDDGLCIELTGRHVVGAPRRPRSRPRPSSCARAATHKASAARRALQPARGPCYRLADRLAPAAVQALTRRLSRARAGSWPLSKLVVASR